MHKSNSGDKAEELQAIVLQQMEMGNIALHPLFVKLSDVQVAIAEDMQPFIKGILQSPLAQSLVQGGMGPGLGAGLLVKGSAIEALREAGVKLVPLAKLDPKGLSKEAAAAMGEDCYVVNKPTLFDRVGPDNYAVLARMLNKEKSEDCPKMADNPRIISGFLRG